MPSGRGTGSTRPGRALCKPWIEDEIRLCERDEDFGPRFIALARSVYHTNDRRAALERRINELLRSDLMEEKSYATGEEPTDREDLQGIGT